MNKALALIPVVFAILALMLSPAVMSVNAAQPETSPNVCEEDNPGVAKAVNNKHCDAGPSEPNQFTYCDVDENGDISAQDLVELGYAGDIDIAQGAIDQAEADAGSKSDNNTVINNNTELRHLNHNLANQC